MTIWDESDMLWDVFLLETFYLYANVEKIIMITGHNPCFELESRATPLLKQETWAYLHIEKKVHDSSSKVERILLLCLPIITIHI